MLLLLLLCREPDNNILPVDQGENVKTGVWENSINQVSVITIGKVFYLNNSIKGLDWIGL